MPVAVEAQNMDRAELDDRLLTRELAHDRADHAAMRHQQRVAIARRPQSEHAFEAALDAIGKIGAALALGISVGRRESIGVPSRELIGIAFANLVRSETFEQSEVHFGEFVDRDERRRVTGDDSRAFGCANQRTRKNARESVRCHDASRSRALARRICARPSSDSATSVRP